MRLYSILVFRFLFEVIRGLALLLEKISGPWGPPVIESA